MGQTDSVAYGINDHGAVAGYSRTAGGNGTVAILWDPKNGIQSLGDLPGGPVSATAHDVNNRNEVVGFGFDSQTVKAFRWTAETGIKSVDSLLTPYSRSRWSIFEAWSINDDGVIAAEAFRIGQGEYRAVLVEPIPFSTAKVLNIVGGSLAGGQLDDTRDSDDSYLEVRPTSDLPSKEPPVWIEFEGSSPLESPATFVFRLETKVNTINLCQKIELFNFNTTNYELVETSDAGLNDDSITVVLNGNVSRFVDAKTKTVKARLAWSPVGLVTHFPWTVSIDQVAWIIGN